MAGEINVVETTLTRNTAATVTRTAATSSVINTAEVFEITPTRSADKGVILIHNVAADQGTVTWSLAAGDFWAASAAKTGSVAQAVQQAIQVETALYKDGDGVLTLTITPADGKRLLTDHTLVVSYVEGEL